MKFLILSTFLSLALIVDGHPGFPSPKLVKRGTSETTNELLKYGQGVKWNLKQDKKLDPKFEAEREKEKNEKAIFSKILLEPVEERFGIYKLESGHMVRLIKAYGSGLSRTSLTKKFGDRARFWPFTSWYNSFSYGENYPDDFSYGGNYPDDDFSYGGNYPDDDLSLGGNYPDDDLSFGGDYPDGDLSFGENYPDDDLSFGWNYPDDDFSYGGNYPDDEFSYGANYPYDYYQYKK